MFLSRWLPGVARPATSRAVPDQTVLVSGGAVLRVGNREDVSVPDTFAVVEPGFSLHDELANFEAAGLDRGRVLALATRGAARFLESDSEVGTVEVGKRADLILLDANPLESLAALRNPAGVMVRGGWLPRETLADMLAGIRSRGVS